MADDFDNTAIKMTAVTEDYSISIKAPKTGATEFAIGGEVASLDTSVTWKRNGEVDNYAIKAGKSMALGQTPMYAGASAKFSFGDSFTYRYTYNGSFTVRRCSTHNGQINTICRSRICMAINTKRYY